MTVTPLGLGTGALGGLNRTIGADEFSDTIETAFDAGVGYYDTAPIYGLGVSESRLGAALRGRSRQSYTLSSKVGRLLRQPEAVLAGSELDHGYDTAWNGVPPSRLVVDFSHDGALRSVEESLSRLCVDRLDIVYIHDTFEPHHYRDAMKGAYPALDRLRRDGTIGALGVGIGRIDVLERFAHDGDFDCFLVAGRYTLLDHVASAELMRVCGQKNIAVVAGAIFNSGILADPYAERPWFDYRPADAALVEKARAIDRVCAAYGVPLKAAALQFPTRHPAVATVLLGAASRSEVEDCLRLAALPIPPGLWNDLADDRLIAESFS